MTPAEEFAAKRLEAEQMIRKHAPERLQSQLIALLRPAIALTATRTDDAQIPVGASKFGGAPNVPSDFEWPMWNNKPLGFLAQINLEEVVPFDMDGLLPKSGLLSFFYDFNSNSWGSAEERDTWRVFHFDQRHLIRPSESTTPIGNRSMKLEGRFEVPNSMSLDFTCGDLALDEENDYRKFYSLLPPWDHKLFGYAHGIQHDELQESCQLAFHNRNFGSEDAADLLETAHEWRLLLQLDCDEKLKMSWGDSGIVQFFVRKSDMASKNFQNCWLQLQCY